MKDAAEPIGSVAGRNDDPATTASDHRERRGSELKSPWIGAILPALCGAVLVL